jgi:hypothetical protein
MSVKDELDKFGKYVKQQAKSNLTKSGKKDTGDLYNGISYAITETKTGAEINFDFGKAKDYWEFIDKGVKGVGGTKADGSSWKVKKVTDSPFKYKDKAPPIKALDGWVLRKGLAGRNEKGQMMSRKSIKFAIVQSIFHTGLATTNFISTPFEKAFQRLPDEIYSAYGLELEEQLKVILK